MAPGARCDVVLNSFESTSNTAFYDWVRTPSKSPECPVLANCAGFGGPCASAYMSSSLATEGLFSARVHLQPDTSGFNCTGSTDCSVERFRTLTLYNFSPRDWSVGYYRLVLDIRRAAGGPTSLIFTLRVQDTGGNLAYSPIMNLTSTMTGGWYPFGFPVSTMVSQGVDTANLKSVAVILPLPLPNQCATVYLDNLRLEPGVPPCPPLAVSAVATGVMGQIRLGWTISCSGTNPVAGYRIYRNTSAIVTLPGVWTLTAATGFLDSGLVNGVRYHYRVVTVDDQSAVSTPGDPADDDADVPWGCSPPGEIAALSATATGSAVNLSWLSPSPGSATILQYEVLRATFAAPPGLMSVVGTVPHTGPGGYVFPDSTVTPGGTYCYVIRTWETLGCSSTSPVACAAVPCNLTPPAGLSGLGFCDRVRLSWSVTTAAEYRIYRSSAGAACGGALVAQPPPAQTSWDDVAVVNGVTYAYAITAWSPACESACSAQQSVPFDAASPCPPCLPPGAPAAPVLSAGSRRVTLTWSRPVAGGSPISRYFVWLGAGSTGSTAGKVITATVWDQPGGPVFTVSVTGLALDTQYCAIVETIDDGSPACTSFTGESCITTACVTPAPPAIASVTPVAAGTLAVTWPRPVAGEEPVSRYLVMRATVSGGPAVVAGTVYDAPVAGFTFTNTGLAPPLEYCFRLLETDAAGCTVWSADACVACTPPGAPLALTAQAFSASAIALGWIPAAPGVLGISRYEVFRSSFAGGTKPLVGVAWGPAAAGALDTPVDAFASWFYLVRAVDEAGCSAYSTERPYVYVPPGPAAPVTVTALLTASGMHLDWAPAVSGSVNLTAYRVWRASTPTGPVLPAGTVWHDPVTVDFTFTDTGVRLDRDWAYRIQVLDAIGGSAWSGPFAYTPAPPYWPANDPAFTVSNAGSSALVSWDAASPRWLAVSRYLVFRSTDAASCAGPLTLTGTTWDDGVNLRFSFTDTGLAPGTAYGYRILGIDLGGNTAFSSCGLAPPCVPPGPPLNLTVAPASPTGLWLSWTPSVPGPGTVSAYAVWRSTYGGGSKPFLANVWGASASGFADLTANPRSSWYYLVTVADVGGCATTSAEAPYVYQPPAPAAPVTVTALLTAAGMFLEWSPPASGSANLTAYVIWRASTATGPVVVAGTVWHDPAMVSFSLTDAGVQLNRGWAYRIQVLDAIGGSAWSGPFTYTPAPPYWAANDPLPTFVQTGSSMFLDWDAAIPGWLAVSRYLVFRSTNTATCSGPLTLTATVWDDGLSAKFSLTDTGLNSLRQYGYRFVAIDLGGSTAFSICTTTPPCIIPVWPGGSAGLTAALVGQTQAALSWTITPSSSPTNPVTRYVVFRTTGATCAQGQIVATVWHDPAATVYAVSDPGPLAASAQYSYEVVAVTVNGCGATANCVTVGTGGICSFSTQPSAVVQPGPTGRPSVRVTWGVTATGSPGTVAIWRGESATGGTAGKSVVATVNMTDGSWLDTGVVAGRTYCYVLVLDVPGISCSATSMESCGQTAALLITVYPNPAEPSKGPVRFDGLPAGSTVEIFTVNGDRVIASPPGAAPLWLWDGRTAGGSPAAPGIYVWLIRGSGAPQRGTLVVGK